MNEKSELGALFKVQKIKNNFGRETKGKEGQMKTKLKT
jgi:hypothetical protein